jgi:hypothetical protein
MEQQQAMSASPGQDEARGRRRTRESENGDDDGHDDQETVGGSGSSKKRRRSRKGLDKKFECPHEGCGKSYSRAEHLYRHQLNRRSTPVAPITPQTHTYFATNLS